MDWASNIPGELRMPDLMGENQDFSRAEIHWILAATGICEELHHLEEEQRKLQRTLQDVLRRRKVGYFIKPFAADSKETIRRISLSLAAGLALSGFILLILYFSGRSIDFGVSVLGGYISTVVAVLAGALFST